MNPFFVVKCLISVIALLLLGACKDHRNVEFFLLHPDVMQATYDKCVYLGDKIGNKKSEECVAVFEALPIFQSYISEFYNTPSQFGMSILRAQMKLNQLKKEYQLALQNSESKQTINDLKKAIHVQEVEIEARFAIIRLTNK